MGIKNAEIWCSFFVILCKKTHAKKVINEKVKGKLSFWLFLLCAKDFRLYLFCILCQNRTKRLKKIKNVFYKMCPRFKFYIYPVRSGGSILSKKSKSLYPNALSCFALMRHAYTGYQSFFQNRSCFLPVGFSAVYLKILTIWSINCLWIPAFQIWISNHPTVLSVYMAARRTNSGTPKNNHSSISAKIYMS